MRDTRIIAMTEGRELREAHEIKRAIRVNNIHERIIEEHDRRERYKN